MGYCAKFEKEVGLLDCLACYFSKPAGKRKGNGRCGYYKAQKGEEI